MIDHFHWGEHMDTLAQLDTHPDNFEAILAVLFAAICISPAAVVQF